MCSSKLNKHLALRLFTLLAVSLLCMSAGYKVKWTESSYVGKETIMAPLIIALQDGFADDLVVVRVNDQEVLRKEDVKTRYQIGLAHSFEVSVQAGSANVEVALPRKNLSELIAVQVSNPVYLGVSVTPGGKISYRVSQEPFGYL